MLVSVKVLVKVNFNKNIQVMSAEKVFKVEITAKDLADYSGKSISSAKKWIKQHEVLVKESVKVSVKNLESPVSVYTNKNEVSVKESVQESVEPQIYTPTPVEPPVYQESPKPKFDFAQMASQSLQDNKTESKSDYCKRLRASMGDVD